MRAYRKLTGIFKGKASLSVTLFSLEVATVILWATNREALLNREPFGWLYFALVIVMTALVTSLGKLGGQLVFRSRKRLKKGLKEFSTPAPRCNA